MKKTISVFLCVIFILSLTACSSDGNRVFGGDGFSITLPSDFKKTENGEASEWHAENGKCVVSVVEDKFSDLENEAITEESSVYDYLSEIINKNNINTELSGSETTSFSYDISIDGNDYRIFCYAFKGSDAFWIFSFASEKDNFDSLIGKFAEWTATVKVR